MILTRTVTGDYGTFGVLSDGEYPLCVTCEDPWKDNKRGESCIPEGEYKVVRHNGPAYKNVWRIENVPNRTGILFHGGSNIFDTTGCVLVGNGFMEHEGVRSLKDSQKTLDFLRDVLPESFTLTIINAWRK